MYQSYLTKSHEPSYTHLLFFSFHVCYLTKKNVLAEHFINTPMDRDSRVSHLVTSSFPLWKTYKKLENPLLITWPMQWFLTLQSCPQLQGHHHHSKTSNSPSRMEGFPYSSPQNPWLSPQMTKGILQVQLRVRTLSWEDNPGSSGWAHGHQSWWRSLPQPHKEGEMGQDEDLICLHQLWRWRRMSQVTRQKLEMAFAPGQQTQRPIQQPEERGFWQANKWAEKQILIQSLRKGTQSYRIFVLLSETCVRLAAYVRVKRQYCKI